MGLEEDEEAEVEDPGERPFDCSILQQMARTNTAYHFPWAALLALAFALQANGEQVSARSIYLLSVASCSTCKC